MGGSSSRRRTVRFSETSQLGVIDCSNDDQQWYDSEDRAHLKRELAMDARRLGKLFATKSPDLVTQDDICHCIGIEHLLSLEKARRVVEYKRSHVKLVVESQQVPFITPDDIRRVSQESSRPARARAQKLAAGYWSMIDLFEQ